MSLPTSQPLPPEDEQSLPPARRRRRQRMILPEAQGYRTEYLEKLSSQATPAFEFFLLSLLGGLLLAFATLLDSPPLYLVAIIIIPFMAPLAGLSLATLVGSSRFFLKSLGGILLGSLFFFLCGALGGLVARNLDTHSNPQAMIFARLSWMDFLMITLAAGFAAYLLARKPGQKPLPASIVLAYELFLPIGVAGFGLSSGLTGLWPEGLVKFFIHLSWSALVGTGVFALVGLRPRNTTGYVLAGVLFLCGLVAAGGTIAMQPALQFHLPTLTPTYTPSLPPTALPSLTAQPGHTLTHTSTPVPPSATPTISLTPDLSASPAPTQTAAPSETPLISPTPFYEIIAAPEGKGAIIRAAPNTNAEVVKTVLNGTLVEIFEIIQNDRQTWARIRLPKDGTEGWIMRNLIATATPKRSN